MVADFVLYLRILRSGLALMRLAIASAIGCVRMAASHVDAILKPSLIFVIEPDHTVS